MSGVCFTHTITFCGGVSLTHPVPHMWGVSLTHPVLFMLGVSLTRPLLFYVESFSYPVLFYVGSFSYTSRAVYVGSYTPLAVLYGEFLLHAPCCFMRGVSLTRPSVFCTRRLTNQCKNKVCWMKSAYRASDQACISCHQDDMANLPNGSCQSFIGNAMREIMGPPAAFAITRLSWSEFVSEQTDTAQSQRDLCAYTTSVVEIVHVLGVLFFLCQLCIYFRRSNSKDNSNDAYVIMFLCAPGCCRKQRWCQTCLRQFCFPQRKRRGGAGGCIYDCLSCRSFLF